MFDCTCLDKYGNTITALYQWDSNQTLYIEDHGFDVAPYFHFCNQNSEKALMTSSKIETDGTLTVVIPNILLTEPYNITAYVYLSDGGSAKTVEVITIPVRPRPMPNDFEYEDNEVVISLTEIAEEMRALQSQIALAEAERVSAETIRVNHENQRINNENARVIAETSRANAETARQTAETARANAENERATAESARETAESERETAEANRVEAENERDIEEANRIVAEQERATAEAGRVTAETARETAETARDEAETTREENETTRQSQETERQTNTATAIENADKATDRANRAAEACEGIVAGTGFIPITDKGLPEGVATLDENGKLPIEQLPDDISNDASAIIFDNTDNRLTASNVQDAIVELANEPTLPDGATYINFDEVEDAGELLLVDSDTLEGHRADYFATAESVEDIIDGTTVVPEATKATFDGDGNKIAETFSDIIDGTTPVGDSNKLGGKDASEYALAEEIGYLENYKEWDSSWTSVKDAPTGVYLIRMAYVTITDLPSDALKNMYLIKTWREAEAFYLLHIPVRNMTFVGNEYGSDVVWNELATTADLANYLPKTGGYYGGCVVSNSDYNVFGVKNTKEGDPFVVYGNSTGILGFIGFNGKNSPAFKNAEQTANYTLLHTGNKPTGTYTGNGSATQRTISTGGIGNTCVIRSTNGFAIVNYGALIVNPHTGTITFQTDVEFIDGELNIANTNNILNASGVTYTYQVL